MWWYCYEAYIINREDVVNERNVKPEVTTKHRVLSQKEVGEVGGRKGPVEMRTIWKNRLSCLFRKDQEVIYAMNFRLKDA